MNRQEVVWLPPHPSGRLHSSRSLLTVTGERPTRVWTLYTHTDQEKAPELPYTPQHLSNAFLEDYVHDWDWRDAGVIRYYSRVISAQDGVWLLLEWDK